MRSRSAEDFDALWFDIDVIQTQTALLGNEGEVFERLKERILEKVAELPLTLNQVKAKEEFIRKVKSSHFWATATEESLETLRLELRGLMKHRQRRDRDIEHLNLEDMTLVREWVEFGPEMEQASVAEYRRRVEEKIKTLLEKNEVLRRLKKGEPIDEADILQLSEILRSEDPYVTEDLLQRIYDNHSAHFIDFIRH